MFLYVKEVGLPSLFLTKVNYFLGNPSAPRPEQTSFGSCCPRLRWSNLLLVHVVRGSDGENCFWFISSEARMEKTAFGSYHPRLGQKKEVLVRPVALVGSLNEF